MNKNDLEALVDLRVKEAKLLFDNRCFEGACHLPGYSLECAIKACIANQVKEHDFPDKNLANKSYTHSLTDLIGVAGLKQKMKDREKQNDDFRLNWAVAKEWSEEKRYEISIDEAAAKDSFEAVTDEDTGILTWVKNWW
jgi:hypothetical protein